MDIKVLAKFNNLTLEEYFNYFHVAKSIIYKLKINKAVLINNNCQDFNYRLKTDDLISIDLSITEDDRLIPSYKNIAIAYEDDDIIIVNKQPGILVHPDGISNDTLCNRLAYYYQQQGYNYSVRPLHRLDLDTSGIVVFCKHFLAHSYLNDLLEKHNINKTYVCLVKGQMENKEGQINTNIAKNRHNNKQMATKNSKFGKPALTRYKLLKIINNNSFLEVNIEGGRRHQIRVHMASINHPIIGDTIYGTTNAKRLMLHFKSIEFIHPRIGKLFKFTIPENF